MDTHGTAAHLLAVADNVVGVRHGVLGILIELVDPVLARHGERVVHGGPLGVADGHIIVIRVVGGLEQREVHDPGEGELLRIEQSSTRTAPSSSWEDSREPAAKNTASPDSAPTAAIRPSRSESDRFLATGPLSSPSSVKDT